MTKQEYEYAIKETEKYWKLVFEHEHYNCNYNRCMAYTNGCYGDECALDVVIESIERLDGESNVN